VPGDRKPHAAAMKLLFTWLLGVPLLVGSMVLARTLPIQAPHAELSIPGTAADCLREQNLHAMHATIPQQRDGIACHRAAVQ
jgi:hypothetical protein